ncbi:MAG: HAD family phosphatase [Patescibacteria group bacterium]
MYKKKFKAIVFDYGGVIELAPPESKHLFEGITELCDVPIHDFRTLYFERNHLNNIHDQSQKETLLSVVRDLTQDKALLEKASTFIDSFEAGKVLNTELISLIQKLKTLGYPIALLSNYTSTLRHKLTKHTIESLFDHIIISSEVGLQKPDPEIFYRTFKALGIQPEEAIFIDDSPKSLSTAAEVGYHPIRFIDNHRLVQELHKLGIAI